LLSKLIPDVVGRIIWLLLLLLLLHDSLASEFRPASEGSYL